MSKLTIAWKTFGAFLCACLLAYEGCSDLDLSRRIPFRITVDELIANGPQGHLFLELTKVKPQKHRGIYQHSTDIRFRAISENMWHLNEDKVLRTVRIPVTNNRKPDPVPQSKTPKFDRRPVPRRSLNPEESQLEFNKRYLESMLSGRPKNKTATVWLEIADVKNLRDVESNLRRTSFRGMIETERTLGQGNYILKLIEPPAGYWWISLKFLGASLLFLVTAAGVLTIFFGEHNPETDISISSASPNEPSPAAVNKESPVRNHESVGSPVPAPQSQYNPMDHTFSNIIKHRGLEVCWIPIEGDGFIEHAIYSAWGGPVSITWFSKGRPSFDVAFKKGEPVSTSRMGDFWEVMDEVDAWAWNGIHDNHVFDGAPWQMVISLNGTATTFLGNGSFNRLGYSRLIYTLDWATNGQFNGLSQRRPVVAEIRCYGDCNSEEAFQELSGLFKDEKSCISISTSSFGYKGIHLSWNDDAEALAVIQPIMENYGLWDRTEILRRFLWEDESQITKRHTESRV